MAQALTSVDRAGREYWDDAWDDEVSEHVIDPASPRIWARRDQLFCEAFRRLLDGKPRPAVLELGCARSAWLPYFAKHHGATICGLDYSPRGVEQARYRLQQEDCTGDIRCADLFDPPDDWRAAFDVVVWFGVAEHFEDPTKAVRAAAAYLKPGGLLIAEIPNLVGLVGALQRAVNKQVYDIHVPHSRESLAHHHQSAGLRVLSAEYIVPIDFGVVELGRPRSGRLLKSKILFALRLLTGVGWWIDRRRRIRNTRLFSGFIIVAAEKPAVNPIE